MNIHRTGTLPVLLLTLSFAAGCGDGDPQMPPEHMHGEEPAPREREYFIAADEVAWNYAPSGMNMITGEPFTDDENVFVGNGPDRIGSEYIKALFRSYTDDTFSELSPPTEEPEHMGFLGPTIRAIVGDTIVVHFMNQTTRPASIHPHGVFYEKDSEGAPYEDGTRGSEKDDDAVPPGETYDYHWQVPERAGPGPSDMSSVMWMYHGHTDEVADVYAGLMGSMVITARDMAHDDATPTDVDRELFTLFEVVDENQSPYLQQNIETYAGDPDSVDPDDEDFGESNLMHSINGYVYGNLPDLHMNLGESVRWYVMGMGTEVDLHTPHWHGNTVLVSGMRLDVVELLPATMVMADMVPDDPGNWLFHCHVHDHILAGMSAIYSVAP